MLKIAEYNKITGKKIELSELKQFGFKEEHWGYIYYPNNNNPSTRYFSSIKINKELMGVKNIIEFCLENMSMWCNSIEELEPNSRKLFDEIMKIADERDRLLEGKQELIDYLKKEQDRLVRECSPIYEDGLGKTRLVNEDIYNEVSKILSKIEKE